MEGVVLETEYKGTIKEYDWASDTYTLELDDGQRKYLVDEDSITPLLESLTTGGDDVA